MIRRLVLGGLVTSAVVIGMLAQAGAYLFALTSPTLPQQSVQSQIGAFAQPGLHQVGVQHLAESHAPIPMMVWYPAVRQEPEDSPVTYSYAMNMVGPDGSVAIATYRGNATPESAFDLSTGPYPLVVLSHGFAITSSSYAWLAEHLASYGMVVVAPDHGEALDPDGLWKSTVDRPEDIETVLTFVDDAVQPGGEFEGLVDPRRVAVIGHSYGGYTALAAGGARMDTAAFDTACETAHVTGDPLVFLCDALGPRLADIADRAGLSSVPAGLWPAWSAPRVDAVVAMAGDAAMFGEQGLAELSVPVMAIGGTADTDSPFEWGTRLTYDNVSSARKVEIELEDAAHLVFAGECDRVRRIVNLVSLGFCSDPAWDRDHAHDLVKHYVTAFVLAELGQDEVAAAALTPHDQHFPAVGYRADGY